MCTHEKVTGVIALLVVGFVVAKGLSLFEGSATARGRRQIESTNE